MTDEQIQALLTLADEATPGPWVLWTGCSWRRFGSEATGRAVIEPTIHPIDSHPDLMVFDKDAAFIVASREAVPALCHELQVVRAFAGRAVEALLVIHRESCCSPKRDPEYGWLGACEPLRTILAEAAEPSPGEGR